MQTIAYCTEVEPVWPGYPIPDEDTAVTHFRFEDGQTDPEVIIDRDYAAPQGSPKYTEGLPYLFLIDTDDGGAFDFYQQAYVRRAVPQAKGLDLESLIPEGVYNYGSFLCTAINVAGDNFTLTSIHFPPFGTMVIHFHYDKAPDARPFRLGKTYNVYGESDALGMGQEFSIKDYEPATDDEVDGDFAPFIVFNRAVDPDTVDADSVKLRAPGLGPEQPPSYIECDIVLSVGDTKITLTPTAPMQASVEGPNALIVTTAVRDALDGDLGLSSDFISEFTISDADVIRPTVLGDYPANGLTDIAVDTIIYVDFSEAMDPLTITDATVVVLDESNAEVPQAADPVLNLDGDRATITLVDDLDNDATYRIRVKTGAHDLAGNAIAAQYTQATGFTTVA